MKAKFTLLVGWVLLYTALPAQTQFWQDDFENATTPDVAAGSTRTPSSNGGTTASYFKRTNNTAAEISLAAAFGTSYGGMTGSFIWAGEDHDGPTGNAAQQIEWTNIAITGRSAISFRGFLAANNVSGAWDNRNTSSLMTVFGTANNTATSGNDYIRIEYAIDAAPYSLLISFFGDDLSVPGLPSANKSLNEDTNGDFIGDGVEPGSINLTQFVRSIPGTGSTMRLRLSVYSNGGNEEWAVDNFRLFGSVLPVEWTHFEVAPVQDAVKLTWGTATEVNSAHFAIERSTDGTNFTEIAQVAAAGNANTAQEYAFEDGAPAIGKSYYRIRQVDVDGQYILSEAMEVDVADPFAFDLYPVPAQDQMYVPINKNVKAITIVDLAGGIVALPMELGTDRATLDVSQLANGMYFARIAHAGGIATRRFVVQR